MKERELSLIDLIFDILLRWRVIVVAMIIGAVVLGGFSYARSDSAHKAQADAAKQKLETMLQNDEVILEPAQLTQKWVEEELTQAQIQNVQSVLAYEKVYEEKLALGKESVWMQAESGLVQKAELTFKVSAADAEQAKDIKKVYSDAVASGELLERLADALGTSTFAVDEIYRLGRSAETLADKLGTSAVAVDEMYWLSSSLEALADSSDTFRVSVSHYDKATCDKLVDIIVEFVNEKCKDFQKTLGAHGVVIANQSMAEITNVTILSYQSQYYNDLVSLQKTVADLKEDFSSQEMQYYNILADRELAELSETAMEEPQKTEAEDADKLAAMQEEIVSHVVTVNPSISPRYVILGAILGAFILAFWYFVVYIMNSRVRAADNLQEIYDIPQLGQISGASVHKKLFGFVDKWIISLRDYNKRKFTVEEAVKLASTAIRMAVGKETLENVYLIGCDLKGRSLELCEQIKAELENEQLRVEILSNVLYDAQAMCDLGQAQGVVLVETAGSTLYNEITQELELLGRQGIRVLGGILVE